MSEKQGIPLEMRRVDVREIIPLRHEVLKPGKPIEVATWKGDELPTTWHIAAYLPDPSLSGPTPVACVSYEPNPHEGEPAFQLRGIATKAEFQRKGIGSRMMAWAETNFFLLYETRLYWCNSRTTAVGFYKKQGWEVVSDVFDMEHVGPCCRMIKRIR